MEHNIIRKLGEGAFGKVHLIEDKMGNRWARKTFEPENNIKAAVGEANSNNLLMCVPKYR